MMKRNKCARMITKKRRYLCPACRQQTVLFLLPTTQVKDLPVKCKRCGVESIVNILPEPAP